MDPSWRKFLIYLLQIKGEVAPQISPRVGENLQLGDPPHGFRGHPRNPRDRRNAKRERQYKRVRFLNALQGVRGIDEIVGTGVLDCPETHLPRPLPSVEEVSVTPN